MDLAWLYGKGDQRLVIQDGETQPAQGGGPLGHRLAGGDFAGDALRSIVPGCPAPNPDTPGADTKLTMPLSPGAFHATIEGVLPETRSGP